MVFDSPHMLSQFDAEGIKCALVTPLEGALGSLQRHPWDLTRYAFSLC